PLHSFWASCLPIITHLALPCEGGEGMFYSVFEVLLMVSHPAAFRAVHDSGSMSKAKTKKCLMAEK
ncbi:hypothetical protein ACQP3C_29385, partial [Escherichia coli]